MVATTFAPQRPAQWNVAGGELVLRISGSSRDGQVVRLRSAKCTIGSGRNCTLRLRAHGVAPVHCLVLRGPAATVVRRWSADTRLNHQFFADALLAPGDRLGIGPIDLEVLEVGPGAARAEPSETDRGADLIEQQWRQWQAEQEEAHRRLDRQREQLAAESAKLETQRNALEAERNALTQQSSAFEDERRQWEPRRGEPPAADGPRQDSPPPAAEVESSSPPPLEIEFQSPSEKAPVDLADVFRRVGAKLEVPEDQPEQEASPTGVVRPRNAEEDTPPVAKASGEGEEESLDAYMGRLMQRIRSAGDGAEASSRTPQSSEPARAAASAAAPAAQPSPPQPECPMPAAQRREPASVLPRAAAPERHVDLSAMRELANLSAHSAISRHARRILVSTMYSKLIVAVVALAACGGLFWMWQRSAPWEVTFYAALIALLVAVYWGVHYSLLTGRLIINKSGRVAWNSSATREQVPRRQMPPPAGQDAHQAPDQSAGSLLQDDREPTEQGPGETASGALESRVPNP